MALINTQPRSQACSIQYQKSGSSAYCRFVVSRLTTFSLGQFRWNYPQVYITKGGGADCTYTFTSVSDTGDIATGSNGDFSVTLTVDEQSKLECI
ncbi:hypothetical protein [Thalassospira sp. HJ]|uniref:hypothetical protein n=1 Tax=Thalassospira sp. HJ TaxID=1616823 RepID=UPI001F273FD8|nr:hypothetical protein [Thalassospira sp. HJ]